MACHQKCHHWQNFSDDRKFYSLNHKENIHINEAIEKCGNDSGKLFLTIGKLTGVSTVNHMPDYNSSKEVADRFATFFWNKVRAEFDHRNLYQPLELHRSELISCSELTEAEVEKLVKKITYYNNDAGNMEFVFQFLPVFFPTISTIVNSLKISYYWSCYTDVWKKAVVRPLFIKRQ